MQKKEMNEIAEKKLASEHKSQKKELEDLEVVYNKKLEYALKQKQEICRKEMVELVELCENNVLFG